MEQEKVTRCLKCNRPLKTPLAKLRGYGALCWVKHNKELESKNRLFEVNEVRR